MEHEGRHIPNTLRRHRKIWNYSQEEVASLLGHVNSTRLSQWENGETMPGAINLIKLSIIYRTIPSELYFDIYSQLREAIVSELKSRNRNFTEIENSGDKSEN